MKKNGKHKPDKMDRKKVWNVEIRLRRYWADRYSYTVVASSVSVAERKAIRCHYARGKSVGAYVTQVNLICTIDA